MRTYVSKVLAGIDTVNTNAAQKDVEALTDRQLIAYDFDTGIEIIATTKNIGFARGTSVLGEALIAGPIPVAGISAILNPYKAAANKVMRLAVSSTPTVGKTVIFKVIYHDNLSIIPNQIKQTAIALVADAANTASATTWAAAISAEFNKQTAELGGNLFVTVAPSTGNVDFTGVTLLTASDFNHIDRPEAVNFEVGAPSDEPEHGVYVVTTTTPLAIGQGDAAKVAWMEEQSMGRFGFSNRRTWNDTKKYPSQVVNGETYDVLVLQANIQSEGDLQDTINVPVGAVICGESDSVVNMLIDLAVAGVVPTTVAAG